MIKPFFLFVALLTLLVGIVSVHYFSYDETRSQTILQNLSSMTALSSPALSVAYYEPRILFYEKTVNPAYPQMFSLDKMDVVYAK